MSEGICWGRATTVLGEEDGSIVFDVIGGGLPVKSYPRSSAIFRIVRDNRRGILGRFSSIMASCEGRVQRIGIQLHC